MRYLFCFLVMLTSLFADGWKKLPEKVHKPLIVIDAGHGGKDEGTHAREKELNLQTATMLRNELARRGYRVLMTRTRDRYVDLEERAALANRTKADLFVSIHYNSAPKQSAQGIEIFYYGRAETRRRELSKQLADGVLEALVKETGAVDRGIKSGNFCVIRETEMPAILIEGGFMSHPSESLLVSDPAYQAKIAKSVAVGIDNYLQTTKAKAKKP